MQEIVGTLAAMAAIGGGFYPIKKGKKDSFGLKITAMFSGIRKVMIL